MIQSHRAVAVVVAVVVVVSIVAILAEPTSFQSIWMCSPYYAGSDRDRRGVSLRPGCIAHTPTLLCVTVVCGRPTRPHVTTHKTPKQQSSGTRVVRKFQMSVSKQTGYHLYVATTKKFFICQ